LERLLLVGEHRIEIIFLVLVNEREDNRKR